MLHRNLFAVALALTAAALVPAALVLPAAQSSPAALTGLVRSQDEGLMEGVLVSASAPVRHHRHRLIVGQGATPFPEPLERRYAIRIRAGWILLYGPSPSRHEPTNRQLDLTSQTQDLPPTLERRVAH